MSFAHGVRIIIDQGRPIDRPYVRCYSHGCTADYEAGPELVDWLKLGQMLDLEAVDAANSPISLRVPLIDFARAYDGAPTDIPVKVIVGPLPEQQKRVEEHRKTRCENDVPSP